MLSLATHLCVSFVANGSECEHMNSLCPKKWPHTSQPTCRRHHRRCRSYSKWFYAAIYSRNLYKTTVHGSVVWATRNFRLTFAIQTIKCKKRIKYIFGYNHGSMVVVLYDVVVPYYLPTSSTCRMAWPTLWWHCELWMFEKDKSIHNHFNVGEYSRFGRAWVCDSCPCCRWGRGPLHPASTMERLVYHQRIVRLILTIWIPLRVFTHRENDDKNRIN